MAMFAGAARFVMTSEIATRIIEAAADYMKAHEAEETQRQYISAKRDVLITALNHERDALLAYFAHRFAERRSALNEFYDLLRKAVENENTEQMQVSLAGILGIIKDNPLSDLEEFRAQWGNPEFKIEL